MVTERSRTSGAPMKWRGLPCKMARRRASHIVAFFLNVLRKQSNGEWKLSHHMWDDRMEQQLSSELAGPLHVLNIPSNPAQKHR